MGMNLLEKRLIYGLIEEEREGLDGLRSLIRGRWDSRSFLYSMVCRHSSQPGFRPARLLENIARSAARKPDLSSLESKAGLGAEPLTRTELEWLVAFGNEGIRYMKQEYRSAAGKDTGARKAMSNRIFMMHLYNSGFYLRLSKMAGSHIEKAMLLNSGYSECRHAGREDLGEVVNENRYRMERQKILVCTKMSEAMRKVNAPRSLEWLEEAYHLYGKAIRLLEAIYGARNKGWALSEKTACLDGKAKIAEQIGWNHPLKCKRIEWLGKAVSDYIEHGKEASSLKNSLYSSISYVNAGRVASELFWIYSVREARQAALSAFSNFKNAAERGELVNGNRLDYQQETEGASTPKKPGKRKKSERHSGLYNKVNSLIRELKNPSLRKKAEIEETKLMRKMLCREKAYTPYASHCHYSGGKESNARKPQYP